jgi:ABC-type multidrug transport system fused ATPase/permease subunit
LEIGLHQFIQAMPNGYQTIIGIDANDFLTPNIKQYILIARELIKDPKIILLDESNINIDLETELVLRHIINLKKGKTTIVIISHKQSLLKLADQHYYIKKQHIIKND